MKFDLHTHYYPASFFQMIREQKERDRKNVLRMGMIDLGVGYGLSIVLAVMFMSLGANLLQPRGLTPNGIDVALTLSPVYTALYLKYLAN